MIKIRINKKFLAILLSTGMIVSLSACSSHEKEAISNGEVAVTEENIGEMLLKRFKERLLLILVILL